MTILLVSPFLDPDAVGEPRWCYDLAKAISMRTETIIVSQTPRKRSYTVADLFPEAQVHEHRPWEMDWLPKRVHALIKPNYFNFYRHARRAIARLDHRAIRCAHQFGPLALRYPSPLRQSGLPYVIGPLGGSLPTPPAFCSDNGGQPWYYKLRDLDGMRFRHDPWLRSSYENAACVVGVAPYVRDVLGSMKLRDFAVWPEVAARSPGADIDAVLARRKARTGPVRFLVVSRLIFSKGVHYALRAAAKLDRSLDWHIDILGDGPMRGELQGLIASLSLGDRVTMHGHVPRARVDDFYRDADVFLFPSIREPSGAVVFEAMSWGLPMISANYGGPAAHVDDSFGRRVPVDGQEAYVDGLAQAMAELAVSAESRSLMGMAALASAKTRHSMEAMAEFYLNLYAHCERK
jgi:glycosyltransferase involved in cell wall biosynthesis